MSKNKLVSILICTYNAEETIKQTLYSCLNQTYDNFEILIHDDKSKDKTIEIINSIGDKRIRIIASGKKLGPYNGLNFLLNHAKGEYVAIQDHDDLWNPTKIGKQIDFLEKNKHYVGCGTNTLMRYEGDNKGFECYLGSECSFTLHPSLVFRNGNYRYPNRNYMNDAYFQKKVLCNGKNLIHNINEILTIHRIKHGFNNYSYNWFKLSRETLNTILYIHGLGNGIVVILLEYFKKFIYPILNMINKSNWISELEFFIERLKGNKIIEVDNKKIFKNTEKNY